MNQQTNTTANTRTVPSTRPPHMRSKRPNAAFLSLLRGAMLVLGGMIVVTGLLLLILPMFRIKTIKVVGVENVNYTEEAIIAASEIKVGDEILGVDIEEVRQNIWDWDTARYIDNVGVKRGLTTVTITVEPPKTVMYTEFNGKYYSIDLGSDYRVLRECENEAELAEYPKVELPDVAALTVGGALRFENADADLSYITELLETLEQKGVLDRVTSLDVSSKFNVSYVTDNSCCVQLGKVSNMDTKLALVGEILSRRGEIGADVYSVVDVTDTQKPTYRALNGADVLSVN